MKKYSAGILNSYIMVSYKAKEYWSKKQKVVSDFMELLKMELDIKDKEIKCFKFIVYFSKRGALNCIPFKKHLTWS